MPQLEFWYDFASHYAYLSAMRIEELAADKGVDVVWRPFLLGPIFADQGWNTSPFNIYIEKGRYMRRDMQRISQARGLPEFSLPDPFPQNGLRAARLAIIGCREGWVANFTKAVFCYEFQLPAADPTTPRDISNTVVLSDVLTTLGIDPEPALARAESNEVKQILREQTAGAKAHGIFGAPAFTTASGELFWGDDRLVQALDFAKNNK